MPVDSATYHSLLNNCIDPAGPVHWLADGLIAVTCIDGGALVLPVSAIGRLDPSLAVALRLKLTPLHAVIMEPRQVSTTPYPAGSADARMFERA